MMRRAIDAKVLELIAEGALAAPDEARFDALALELFRYQLEHNAPYRRLCEALGAAVERVSHWREIPPVPTGAFKEARLATFPEADEVRTFRTSGSTTERRGELHLDTLELYDASLAATFGAFVCVGVQRIRFLVLAPSLADAPDSSLSYMFDAALRRWGAPESRFYLPRAGRSGRDGLRLRPPPPRPRRAGWARGASGGEPDPRDRRPQGPVAQRGAGRAPSGDRRLARRSAREDRRSVRHVRAREPVLRVDAA
jgi:hypothetical protein